MLRRQRAKKKTRSNKLTIKIQTGVIDRRGRKYARQLGRERERLESQGQKER